MRMSCGVCVSGDGGVGGGLRRANLGGFRRGALADFTMRLAELSPVWLLGAVGLLGHSCSATGVTSTISTQAGCHIPTKQGEKGGT